MHLKVFTYLVTVLLLFLFSDKSKSQSIPVGSFLDSQIEIQRLLSDSTIVVPTLRPYSIAQYDHLMDQVDSKRGWWNIPHQMNSTTIGSIVDIGLAPMTIRNTINTRFPYSENNGAAWFGRGFNTEWMGGFFLRNDFFSFTISPHIIYQENVEFLEPRRFSEVSAPYVSEIGGNIDTPFRFGPDSYTTFDWGNSSIKFHYNKLETGLSTEPLWWSGSKKYPLLMSNNAPGIHHFFFGTSEPIRVPYFGYLHFKWIMGYPQESGYFAGERSGITRFLNAGNISYSPSFYHQLTLGVNRAYHVYQENGFDFSDIFLLFDPIRRSSLVRRQGDDDLRQARNQIASFYIHLDLPAANAEIYAEFFREDHSLDFRDLFVQPHHNSAYTFGFQKISFTPFFDFIKTNLEFTNLTSSQLNQVRPQAFFYTHDPIAQGHTNKGQILGAAIGPGSNSQYLSMDAYKNNFSIGFFIQRLVNNDNLHFRVGSVSQSPFREFGDYFRHSVNLNSGINFLYRKNQIILQSRLAYTKAYNYGRLETAVYNGYNLENHNRIDRVNFQLQFGITYLF